jgi:V/A-type H+-transporting ATPase subunit I
MLNPEQMNRILLVGSKGDLKATIDLLYKSEAVDIIDFSSEEEGFNLGTPLPESSVASQKLLKLRSLEKDMQLDVDVEPTETMAPNQVKTELDKTLAELDESLGKVLQEKSKAQSELAELQNERHMIEPFVNMDLPLDLFRGYSSLSVLTGYIRSDPSADISSKVPDGEVFLSSDKKFAAVFVPKKDLADAQKILLQNGFVEVPAPNGSGDAKQRLAAIDVEVANMESALEECNQNLEDLRTKYGAMICAADEDLSIDVQVAETPLRLGMTKYAFVMDGWVPTSKMEPLRNSIEQDLKGRVFLDVLETVERRESHEHDTEHLALVDYTEVKSEVPTKTNPNKYVGLYEYLTGLISTPKYREIDPTFMISLTFPLFFGLMVGDFGYGLGFTLLGLLGLLKVKTPEWKTIATMLFFGGIWAIIFGVFVFGECLGMHLQPIWIDGATPAEYPFGNEVTWSYVLQMELPKLGVISKLVDVKMFLFLALVIGFVHLGIGYVIGIYNKTIRYGLKHAILEKASWLLILIGGFFLLLWFINEMILPIGSWWGLPLIENYLYIGIGLVVVGTVMAFMGEGGGAILELPGLMSNVLSYSRLAAIGMSKAGLALAFNTMAFITIGTAGINAIFAIMLFVLGCLMVFILAIISAGMHGIRLHFVELFSKFFEGGGARFNPLRIVRRWTSEKIGE